MFALASILAMAVLQPAVQANAIAERLDNAFGITPTITGGVIVILFTGMYNTQGADGLYIVHNVGEMEPGPGYTQAAIDSILPGFGVGFLAIALLFFAFTTIMALYDIAETNVEYLT